jgi:hypothetical protein
MDPKKLKHPDHEAEMARGDLYKLAKYSVKLLDLIQEGDELEGWMQAKITKASDYISSVYHRLEYERAADAAIEQGPRDFDESIEAEVKTALKEQWLRTKQGK